MTNLILLACTLLLAGCLDYDEEMWLNSNFSGEVLMTLTLPDKLSDPRPGASSGLSEDQFRKDMESAEGLQLKSFESFKESGKQVTRIRIAFTHVEKLNWFGERGANPSSILGKISVSLENGHPVIKRTLDSISASRSKNGGEELLARGLGSLLVGNNRLEYTVHFPGEIVAANSTQIDKQTRTVRWKFPLDQALTESITMRAEWKRSSKLFWLIGGMLALTAAGFVCLKLRRNK